MSNYEKSTKAGFVRELCAHSYYYVWCGGVDKYDMDYIAERLNEIHDDIIGGDIVEMRTYTNTSGNRVVSNTGSILDLNKRDTVYKFANGYIVDDTYNRWAYVRMD